MKKIFYTVLSLLVLWNGASYALYSISGRIIYQTSFSKSYQYPQNSEVINVQNNAHENIELLWLPKPKAKDSYLYLHGNVGRLPYIIEGLAKEGNVLSPAYPGFSGSTGKSDTNNINQVVDISMAFLGSRGITPEHVIVVGHSLGGAPAVYAATKYPNLKKVILVNTFSSMKDMCELKYYFLCIFSGDIHNSLAFAPKAKAQVREFHNPKDELIPYEQGKKLFEKLGSVDKKFFDIAGTHANFNVKDILED